MVTDYNRQTVVQRPSRFVTEVPPDLYEIWSLEEESEPAPPLALTPGGNGGTPDEYVN